MASMTLSTHRMKHSNPLLSVMVRIFIACCLCINSQHGIATFLKVTIDSVDATWQTDVAALRIALMEGLRFSFNNIAQLHHKKTILVSVPKIELQMLLPPTTGKQWLETFRFETSISLDLYTASRDWRSHALAQNKFVSTQDEQTKRFVNMGNHKLKPGWLFALIVQWELIVSSRKAQRPFIFATSNCSQFECKKFQEVT